MNTKIGIIGGGFVGYICYQAFSQLKEYEVRLHDKNEKESKAYKEGTEVNFVSFEKVSECDVIFIALPTPMVIETGECHTGIVDRVVAQVRAVNKDSFLVIKSTVPPATTERLNFSYGKIAFSPEFLTEANSYEDFTDLPYQILGYSEESHLDDSGFQIIQKIFFDAYSQGIMACKSVHSIAARTAELCKYTRNTYLATRLSFFNEIKQICDELGVDYNQLKYYAGMDERVGNHYNSVDEDNPGFGLSCLPKDIGALIYKAKELGVNPAVLRGVVDKNDEVRIKRDWEEMQGRAVIKKEK